MKNRKKRYCTKCNGAVVREKHIKVYDFYCKSCDENMFKFETYKSKKNK